MQHCLKLVFCFHVFFKNTQVQVELRTEKIKAVINVGTAYFSYAYYIHEQDSNESICKSSKDSTSIFVSPIIPGSILIRPSKEEDEIGFTAEENFEGGNENFFRNIQEQLFMSKELRWNTSIIDINGRTMKLLEVLSIYFTVLKNKLLEDLRKDRHNLVEEGIEWIVTIPISWSENAKQLTKEALFKHGRNMDPKRITIVFQEEAAAFSTKECALQLEVTNNKTTPFTPGSKFTVMSVRELAADFTVLEITEDQVFKTVNTSDNQEWVWESIITEFWNRMEILFGTDVYNKFVLFTSDFIDIERQFEEKMENAETLGDISIELSVEFLEIIRDVRNKDLAAIIRETFSDLFDFKANKLVLRSSVLHQIVLPFVTNLNESLDTVNKMLQNSTNGQDMYIIPIGELAMWKSVRSIIKERFSSYKVLEPQDALSLVSKGAVLYGIKSGLISSRVSRYSYGLAEYRQCEYNKHEHDKVITIPMLLMNLYYCREKFVKLVEKGQEMKADTTISVTGIMARVISLYQCTSANPRFVYDEGCSLVGDMVISNSSTEDLSDHSVDIAMSFAATEIIAEAKFSKSGIVVPLIFLKL